MELRESGAISLEQILDFKLPASQLKKKVEKKTGLAFGYQVF